MQTTRFTTYYSNVLADVTEAVRWTAPVNATVSGPAAGTVTKLTAGGWSGGAVGSRAIGSSPGAFQGALAWQVPAGWDNHFFLGLVAADADATDPNYPSFTLGLYLNVDTASGHTLSFDVYQAGTTRYESRQATPPVYWHPGARVEVQVWRAAGGGFTGRFLLDERLVYELPLPALTFPLTPHLSLHGAGGQAVGGFALRGPALVASGYGPAGLPAAGLRLHLRPDQGLTQAPDGTVAAWADQSGAGWLLHPVAGPAPTLGALAGGQGVYLNGNQCFELLDLGGPPPEVFTVALVLQAAHTNAQMPLGFGPDMARANDLWCYNNAFGLNTFSSDVYGITPAAPVTEPVLVMAELHSSQALDFRLWLNCQPQEVTSCHGTPSDRPLGTVLGFGASGYRDIGIYSWQGWLGELAVYDRVLSLDERRQVYQEMRQRYPALPAYVSPTTLHTLSDVPDPAPPTAADVPAAPRGWWRAANGLHRTSGGRLLSWDDLSGHGHTLVPDATLPPPLLHEWAGGRALFFGGQHGLAALDLGGPAPDVLTAALLLQKPPGVTSVMPIHFGDGPNQDLWAHGGSFGLNTYNSDIQGIYGADAWLEKPVLVVAEIHSGQPTAFRLWLNGQAQTVTQLLVAPVPRTLETIVRLGGYSQWRWRGWLAEVLLYDRPLTDAEQAQLLTYGQSRYQLPS